jgi:hypothetical protein
MIVIPNEVRDLQFRFRLSYRSLVRSHEGIPRYVLSLVAQALLPVRRYLPASPQQLLHVTIAPVHPIHAFLFKNGATLTACAASPAQHLVSTPPRTNPAKPHIQSVI